MYNRYIRNDNGTYTRMPEEESHTPPGRTGLSRQTRENRRLGGLPTG